MHVMIKIAVLIKHALDKAYDVLNIRIINNTVKKKNNLK